MEWISVKDDMPKPMQKVLTFSVSNGVAIGAYMEDGRWIVVVSYPDTPSHWMPLPEPPKEGAQE